MLGLWMVWVFSVAPVIRVLPDVEEILERFVGKEQDGCYGADNHKQQHRRHLGGTVTGRSIVLSRRPVNDCRHFVQWSFHSPRAPS